MFRRSPWRKNGKRHNLPPKGSPPSRSYGRTTAWLTFIVCSVCALATYASYRRDCALIGAKALEIVRSDDPASRKVLALNTWLHRHLRTSKNPHRFVLDRLRATPLQVLEHGGDCADKSRLLAAMLREIGIPATMALCFHPTTGEPSHTVVEAEVENKEHMLVDPAFELHYPESNAPGYFGILDLRRRPEILNERVAHVQATTARFRPLHWYDPDVAGSVGLSTFNWSKNRITRLARDVLFLAIGKDVYRWPRPVVMEEPKLAVAATLFALGTGLALATIAAGRLARRRTERVSVIVDAAHCTVVDQTGLIVSPATRKPETGLAPDPVLTTASSYELSDHAVDAS